MATLNEYIYEEVLNEEMKLNKLSNKLGKIILTVYNSLSKLENGNEYDKQIQALKRMRVELLTIEKKYYSKQIDGDRIKAYMSSYIKALKKIKEELTAIDDKRINRAMDKMDSLIEKMKKIKTVL